MQKIISVQGNKWSGKDTVAKMLQYLLSTPKILHKYDLYCRLNWFKKDYKIVRYADKMKEMLAILLNTNVQNFEDREFKEQYYVDFNTLQLIHVDESNINTFKDKILSDTRFTKEIKRVNPNLTKNYFLSIRQILQYFGTEIMRFYFGDRLWILSTLNNRGSNIIISDQRFIIENITTYNLGAVIIHITRPGCEKSSHSSETELDKLYQDKAYSYLIENNGTLRDLFNNCKKLVQDGLFD